MLDSSVWISLFSEDSQLEKALRILMLIPEKGMRIIVPIIVYLEVINWLNRQKFDNNKRDEIRNIFLHGKKIIITYPEKGLWYKAVENYGRKVKLKSLDLLILSFALDSQVAEFYSFDKKLYRAYQELTR